ncbi:MAG: hypothetical protein LC793_14440 [Thermomicrobia bacterium]|nr:hypothetical protein [Thermomicrobia bacterium]
MRASYPASVHRQVVATAVASLLVTLPHSFEDFVAGVPGRFGLSVLAAGFLLACAYAVHVVGIVLAARGSMWGSAINLLVGIGWLLSAAIDHVPEILRSGPYRAGLPSKAFEVGIMAVATALIVVSARALGARQSVEGDVKHDSGRSDDRR